MGIKVSYFGKEESKQIFYGNERENPYSLVTSLTKAVFYASFGSLSVFTAESGVVYRLRALSSPFQKTGFGLENFNSVSNLN